MDQAQRSPLVVGLLVGEVAARRRAGDDREGVLERQAELALRQLAQEGAAVLAVQMVRSSWVGPTPPEVKTWSKRRAKRGTVSAMSSRSSGITEIRRSSTPSERSSAMRKRAFSSPNLPDRISSPITTMPAVAPTIRTLPVRGRLCHVGPAC